MFIKKYINHVCEERKRSITECLIVYFGYLNTTQNVGLLDD